VHTVDTEGYYQVWGHGTAFQYWKLYAAE